jgi:hypothetical protein
MGGATVPLTDSWAVQYNIGALADLEESTVAAGYQTRFNLPELSTAAVLIATPLRFGVAGASFSRWGFGPLSMQEGSLGLAHKIHLVSLGVQGGFVQMATEGFGSRMVPLLTMGGTAQLLPSLRFGGSVYNITQSQLQPETGEYLPTLLRAGLLWQPTELLRLVVQTDKDVDFPAQFRTGMEYQLRSFLHMRTGFSTQPFSLHGGFGLWPGPFRMDYALQHHGHIGLQHHLSFSRSLQKK